ncbi:MAG: P-II family nitrogen regulator, partial [Clostridia bacterium]|nr:P-II family nitrogen regulator [Clostridia bacterium]
THFYRGNEIITNLHPKTKLEIVVKDSWVNEVIETIIEITKTGNVGDGKIFIYDIENAYRIRTGQSGEDALV